MDRTPWQRWGTCCPNDPECAHSFITDRELERHLNKPITDDEARVLAEPIVGYISG